MRAAFARTISLDIFSLPSFVHRHLRAIVFKSSALGRSIGPAARYGSELRCTCAVRRGFETRAWSGLSGDFTPACVRRKTRETASSLLDQRLTLSLIEATATSRARFLGARKMLLLPCQRSHQPPSKIGGKLSKHAGLTFEAATERSDSNRGALASGRHQRPSASIGRVYEPGLARVIDGLAAGYRTVKMSSVC